MKNVTIKELEDLATKIRINSIEAIRKVGAGHIGGSLSIVELLAVLYGSKWFMIPKILSGKSVTA